MEIIIKERLHISDTDIVEEQCVQKVAVHCAPPDFYLWGAAKSAVYCDRPRTLNP